MPPVRPRERVPMPPRSSAPSAVYASPVPLESLDLFPFHPGQVPARASQRLQTPQAHLRAVLPRIQGLRTIRNVLCTIRFVPLFVLFPAPPHTPQQPTPPCRRETTRPEWIDSHRKLGFPRIRSSDKQLDICI